MCWRSPFKERTTVVRRLNSSTMPATLSGWMRTKSPTAYQALEQDEQASAHVIQEPFRAEGDEQDDERPAAEGRGRVFDEDADDREDRDEDDAVAEERLQQDQRRLPAPELDQSLRVLRAARGRASPHAD